MGLSKKIAYRLRTLRESAHLSQQEVADRSDLSLSLIAKMEQGRKADPRASTILALAGALDVRPGQLIEDLVEPPDGTVAGKKGKKDKKKKKKLLETLTATVGNGTNGTARSVAPDVPDLTPGGDGKERKKKKKKDR
ncbi:MAG: helix-turn-helix transcriptional regulator [Planctomycetes bacterium]|nr:helix-turn-helix transcriptional regulator [Planctomycetota bacterium]